MPAGEKMEGPDSELIREEFPQTGIPRWVAGVLGLLAILSVSALWISNHNLRYSEKVLGNLNRETQSARTDTGHLSRIVSDRLATMDRQNASLWQEVNMLSDELESAESDARLARRQATRVGDQAREQIRHLAAMDSEVQQQLAKKASIDDLKTISTDVNGVRDELQTTSDRLKSGHSDLGFLIARNHDEIEILRQRGDRDYFEFTIAGKNQSQKMGDITLTLRNTDPKKNECNLELFVDDKTTQKRNRAINEPIFFYKDGQRVPSEIVINEVRRNEVSGYLSVPKQKQQVTVAGANVAAGSPNIH
jgi:hypothetical protein